jgi:hypothetical protein
MRTQIVFGMLSFALTLGVLAGDASKTGAPAQNDVKTYELKAVGEIKKQEDKRQLVVGVDYTIPQECEVKRVMLQAIRKELPENFEKIVVLNKVWKNERNPAYTRFYITGARIPNEIRKSNTGVMTFDISKWPLGDYVISVVTLADLTDANGKQSTKVISAPISFVID